MSASKLPAMWGVPTTYHVGERVLWNGLRLVCCLEHYAGDSARHPWDPGWGWPVKKAAALWAPDGPAVAEAMREMVPGWEEIGDRLAECAAVAAGGQLAA